VGAKGKAAANLLEEIDAVLFSLAKVLPESPVESIAREPLRFVLFGFVGDAIVASVLLLVHLLSPTKYSSLVISMAGRETPCRQFVFARIMQNWYCLFKKEPGGDI
jgi:hypothetical protein